MWGLRFSQWTVWRVLVVWPVDRYRLHGVTSQDTTIFNHELYQDLFQKRAARKFVCLPPSLPCQRPWIGTAPVPNLELCSRGARYESRPGHQLFSLRYSFIFLSPLYKNAWIALFTMSRPFSSTALQIDYSLSSSHSTLYCQNYWQRH